MARPSDDRPRGQSTPGSPGISGAIKDAVAAVASATAPRSIVNRKANVDNTVDDESLGRMRAAQSTDRDNSYSY